MYMTKKSFNSKGFANRIVIAAVVSIIVITSIAATLYFMSSNVTNIPINGTCTTNDFMKFYRETLKNQTNKYLGKVIHYSISVGPKPPGSKVDFNVMGYYYDPQLEPVKEIKMEIYFHDPNKKICKKIYEISSFSSQYTYTLGNETNVYYIIVIKVINYKGEIVDGTTSLIEVPIQEVNAKLVSDKRVYGRWDKVRYCLVNEGSTRIIFGLDYYVYYYNGTGWTVAEWLGPGIVPDIGLIAGPGQVKCFELYLNGTKPGKYMLVKEISAEGVKDGKRKLTLEFEVAENLDLVKITSLTTQIVSIANTFEFKDKFQVLSFLICTHYTFKL
jgi:hypothetical protein